MDNISTAIGGERPPVGFEELHAAWQDTASLNERLLAAGSKVNKDLEKGTSFTGRILRSSRMILRSFVRSGTPRVT